MAKENIKEIKLKSLIIDKEFLLMEGKEFFNKNGTSNHEIIRKKEIIDSEIEDLIHEIEEE